MLVVLFDVLFILIIGIIGNLIYCDIWKNI